MYYYIPQIEKCQYVNIHKITSNSNFVDNRRDLWYIFCIGIKREVRMVWTTAEAPLTEQTSV